MSKIVVRKAKKINGRLRVPADKSITHRAIMLSSIARGDSTIHNFLKGDDCLATMDAFKKMGIRIEANKGDLIVYGRGLYGLKRPESDIYLGNSGTTARLLMGILASQPFSARLTGDASLSKRPMKRVTEPLARMGARFAGGDAEFLPITVSGSRLKPIAYKTPVPSAQVKSAILFAGLYADGTTRVSESFKSRDHTERMLKTFGADIEVEGLTASIKGARELEAKAIRVPGDISSASFFIVLAMLLNKSRITIQEVGVNPTRTGLLEALKRMGGKISLSDVSGEDFELQADIGVSSSRLRGIDINKEEIPAIIDEIPILMVAAAVSEGSSVIRGAGELRVKETDRLASMVTNLSKMGASIEAAGDDIVIEGRSGLKGAAVGSFGDHRTAMASVIAGLLAEGESTIEDTHCIDTSFPRFMDTLKRLVIF